MILKAVALFATGEQQQAIAVVSEAQLVLSRAKSKTKQKDEVADLTLDIEQSFMKMAAMRALMSDWRGCLETVREVPESDEPLAAEIPDIRLGVWIEARILRFSDNRFMVGSSLATDCAALAAKYPSQTPHLTPASQTVSSSILNQIDGVVRTGRYSTLPDPQVDSGIGNGAPNINIKNDTRYDLTILCAGPSEQSMQIAAGQTSNIPLQAGTYRMVGQVDSPNILPLYKQYSFNSGSTYNFDFYIAAH